MALSTSILAYSDCKEFLDRALSDPIGARLPFRSEDQATRWRMRCNQFRQLDRRQNMQIYSLGHKMFGHSEYDLLTLTIKQSPDAHWVYAEKLQIEPGAIESLSEVPQMTMEEIKLLEDRSNDNEAATGDLS